jgi:hypothetical protein
VRFVEQLREKGEECNKIIAKRDFCALLNDDPLQQSRTPLNECMAMELRGNPRKSRHKTFSPTVI